MFEKPLKPIEWLNFIDDENIKNVKDLVLANRHASVLERAEEFHISRDSLRLILEDFFGV